MPTSLLPVVLQLPCEVAPHTPTDLCQWLVGSVVWDRAFSAVQQGHVPPLQASISAAIGATKQNREYSLLAWSEVVPGLNLIWGRTP